MSINTLPSLTTKFAILERYTRAIDALIERFPNILDNVPEEARSSAELVWVPRIREFQVIVLNTAQSCGCSIRFASVIARITKG